jgi:acetate kinase
MKIVVCNIGSSSFKFQLLDMATEHAVARGYTERVGAANAIITYWIGAQQVHQETASVPSHREAVQQCGGGHPVGGD